MAEIKNSESDMSTQQKAEQDKEKRREERGKKERKGRKGSQYCQGSHISVYLYNNSNWHMLGCAHICRTANRGQWRVHEQYSSQRRYIMD